MEIFILNGELSSESELRQEIASALTENDLSILTRQDGKKSIPAYIFCQSGKIRETWTTNHSKWTLSKVESELLSDEPIYQTQEAAKKVKATSQKEAKTTDYNNGYVENQGIGSRSRLFRGIKWRF